MAKEKTRLVRGRLMGVSSQRTQYKPYGYQLEFPGLWVEIEIPASTVVEVEGEMGVGQIVVNLDGLKAILSATADAVDELDEEYRKKYEH